MAPWQTLMIEGNGTVQPCAYRGNYGNPAIHPPLGNVNKQSIAEIWNGEEAQKLRRWMADGDLEAAGCAKCLAVAQNLPLGLSYDLEVDKPGAIEGPYKANLDLKRKEIAAGKAVIESKPLVLYLTPTHRCNLRCTHCYEAISRSETIRQTGLKDEVAELLPMLSEIVPGGGEPLVLSFWRTLFDPNAAKSMPHLKLSFTTGGHHVPERVFNSIPYFSDSQVMVSFDAPDKHTFEQIRKNAVFENVVDNIVKFRDITSKKKDFSTTMHISVMKQNIRLLPEFIRLASALEIAFNFQPVVVYPVDHSLVAIEHGPSEMEGWRESITEAKRLIADLLVPTLTMVAERNGRLFPDFLPDSYQSQADALSGLIPWDILEIEHFAVRGVVPDYHRRVEEFRRSFKLSKMNGMVMLVGFFPIKDGAIGTLRHYARIDSLGSYDVELPKGSYACGIFRRDYPAYCNSFWNIEV